MCFFACLLYSQGRDAKYVYTFGTPGSGYFFGARVNPNNSNYLDMRLEGDASGWVAIGFSETASMVHSHFINHCIVYAVFLYRKKVMCLGANETHLLTLCRY